MVYEFDSAEPTACLSGVSLPWLVLTPTEGFVPAAGMGPGALPVNVEFIADGLDHYGLVQATHLCAPRAPRARYEDATVCFTKPLMTSAPPTGPTSTFTRRRAPGLPVAAVTATSVP